MRPAGIVYYPRYFEMSIEHTAMFSAATGLSKWQMFVTFRSAAIRWSTRAPASWSVPLRRRRDDRDNDDGGKALQLQYQHH